MRHFKIILLCIACFGLGFVAATFSETELATELAKDSAAGLDKDEQGATSGQISAAASELQENDASGHLGAASAKVNSPTVEKNRVVAQLQNDIAQLEDKLAAKDARLNQAMDDIDQANEGYQARDANTDIQDEVLSISKQEADAVLPKPFSKVLAGATGELAKNFNEFNKEAVDHDWGYNMEMNIKDFIAMHTEADKVNLASVVCKTSSCEIRGFEQEDHAWGYLLKDMQVQEWWDFTSTNSSNSSSEEYGQYFYLLASKGV